MEHIAAAVPQGVGIASAQFLAFILIGVPAVRAMRATHLMPLLLVALNLYFLTFFTMKLDAAVALFVLLAAIYLLGEIKVRMAGRIPEWVWTVIVIGFWILLFLIKDPDLFAPLNPFFHFPVSIVGISYLIFRSINYIVDVDILERRSPLTFVNFMLFWPALIAGPIERFDNFADNHDGRPAYAPPDILPLLHRIANGFIKKFVIADNLAAWGVFEVGLDPGYGSAVVAGAILLQIFIIYMDFSGYCDIMIGLAGLMGFRIVENFDRPFASRDLQIFWTRWHISLTSFIRDYVFTPLSRFALPRLDRSLHFGFHLFNYFLTMMLIALWHDTTWGFFVFGLLHGTVMVAIQIRKRYLPAAAGEVSHTWAIVGPVLTYCYVSTTVTLWYFGVEGSLAVFGRVLAFE